MVNFLEMTRSRLRQKLLSYFFTNPNANLYLREIASVLKEDPGNLSKEFAKLEKEGIFISTLRGNQKYFSLNKKYPLYKELKSIIFKTIGIPDKEAEKKFGFLLKALELGAPPHGGFALGLDRMLQSMLTLDSIRDVIAFPKTQRGLCLLTDAPSIVDPEQLLELKIKRLKESE